MVADTSQKSAERAAAAHDAFLAKIGSKISVIARDGSQIPTNSSSHFVKPFRQRVLPMVALKYRPKTPKQSSQMRAIVNPTRIPNAVIPPLASQDSTNINILIQKRISDNLKAKKMVEDVLAASQPAPPRDVITKIPTVKRTSSFHGEEDDTIFNLEQKEEAKRNILKDLNPLETLILEKISEWPSWGTDMMRDLTRIIEPMYAADMLRASVKDLDSSAQKETEAQEEQEVLEEHEEGEKEGERVYNFNTTYYDNNAVIPATGLFFAVIDTHQHSQKSLLKKSRESNQSRAQFSRAGSSYSEIHRAKSAATSIIPSPKSQSALSLHPQQQEEGEHYDQTTTSYHPIERADFDNLPDIPNYEDFNNDGEDGMAFDEKYQESLDTFSHTPVAEQVMSQVAVEDTRPTPLPNDSDTSHSITTRSSSSSANHSSSAGTKKFKPAFFPPADIKLGGLGPDRDNESYLSKMEKVRKQKEYADSIRKNILSKPKKLELAHMSQGSLVPIVFEKQSAATKKLPKIHHPRAVSDSSLVDAALTKHQRMKLYANRVKRPVIGTSRSLPDMKRLPPIDRFRNLSAPISQLPSSPKSHLMKLEQKHLLDQKVVEEIRRHYY